MKLRWIDGCGEYELEKIAGEKSFEYDDAIVRCVVDKIVKDTCWLTCYMDEFDVKGEQCLVKIRH